MGMINSAIISILFIATLISELILIFSKSYRNAIYLNAATFYSWSTIFGASFGILIESLHGGDRKL